MAVSLREVLTFGRYEPLFRIASGGMAEVYAARIRGEAGFQKLVAIKRMHPHMASDAGFVDMFLNEARLAAHIASPYVVQTLDLGRSDDGALYIVMELVVGVSLAQLEDLIGGPVPAPIALELMAQAAQGLDDAHEATTPAGDPLGLIHRDVSPHNILVGLDGRARVTDFGIARAVHRPRAETNVKELKGKFAYMSPEQTRLLPLDRRSDVFSLGVVLWEELVGERLFAERGDPTQCIRNVRNKVVPPPEGVPQAVQDVVLKALDRHRDHRYQSAAELAEDLRRVGREQFGRLPDRKSIGAWVKEVGGEELERLQRLIRLGTEGADAEAIEAVRPGVTRVSGLSASGVSEVRRPGTERIDEVLPKIPTVTLPPEEDDTQAGVLLESRAIPTDVLMMRELQDGPPTRDLKPKKPPRAPPPARELKRREPDTVDERVRALPPPGVPTRAYEKAAPAPPAPAPIEVRRSSGWTWMVIGVLAGVALVGGALGVWVFWPDEPERVPLPLEPRSGGEPPVGQSVTPPPAQPVEPVEPEPPPAPEAVSPPERDPQPIPEPRAAPRRPRRRGATRRAPQREPEPSGPDLMDVDAFDRHAP